MRGTVALTGATGFVGHAIAQRLIGDGWRVRAMTRRPSEALAGLGAATWAGDLGSVERLREFVTDADAVVHCAGLVRARRADDFAAVNAGGTARLLSAVREQGNPARFLYISSLAARHAEISHYAASKRAAEEAVRAAAVDIDAAVVRPPAIYGPRDRATLPLFQLLARGWLLMPSPATARFSLLHVDDLAGAVAHLLEQPRLGGVTVEPDDGRDGGYDWPALAAIAAARLGRPVRPVRLPHALLLAIAAGNQTIARLVGQAPMLSLDKLREMRFPDWVSEPPQSAILDDWAPRLRFEEGFAQTLAWYRTAGWV
ncbi:NAD-dependent epimerase/dehydratase family protein [Oceanibacterium hippocampi]|uniref:3 beta-hydroxysteroid dehydrogenase/Delta 5-->4-isomerase n=1 Tax=Oceanibacterium hippocampi TaxID=745714 RepID=A0A1Y5U3C0_9PROT|nr:SDR family NAD(P)-dependent oxidoreductase [Oceanibacterium hippocampi]SLN76182.1 3 beta-hydroxysteroid dehydrogenase/Delta 5-->4-isomerase [Oceanibacterium hippocampi]